jgi:hypothetical protein
VKKLLFALLMLLFTVLARPSRADVDYDVNLQLGYSHRFHSCPEGGCLTGSNGPVLLLQGDIALAPLARVGIYVDEELGVDGEPRPPFITSFGGRFSLTPPLPSDRMRFWVFVGVGFAAVYAPGYHQSLPFQDTSSPTAQQNGGTINEDATIPAATGSFIELPFGVGGSYRLRRPWVLLAELSGRPAFNCNGAFFDPTARAGFETAPPNTPTGVPVGSESFALFFTAGVGLDL